MNTNTKTHLRRAVLLALTLALLMTALIIPTTAAEEEGYFTLPEDGYYRIKNVATGKYLDTYDLVYDWQGSAYLDYATGQNGQDFYVSRGEDGAYTFVGASDGGKYAISTAAGSYLNKQANPGENEAFDVFAMSEDTYGIVPAYGNGDDVVAAGKTKTYHGFTRVVLAAFTGEADQQWVFEPILATDISMGYTELRERLYTVGTYYATATPYTDAKLDMKWSSDNESVLMIDDDGSWVALGVGRATVTVTCGKATDSCVVEVVDAPAYAYYSQHDIDGTYWNGSALSGIYFTSGSGVTKRYAVDRYNQNGDWMDQGCALTAHAMALRNLGATLTDGFDFRSGQKGNLPADPYTVSLANTSNTGATSANQTLYGNPIYVNHHLIATRFQVDGRDMKVTQTYIPNARQIKEALDKHPEGVIVGMENYAYGSHYFLFTKCLNPEETNPYNYRFEVCDPAAYDSTRGDHVAFDQSYSYISLGYRLSHVTCMLTWDVAPAATTQP